MRTHQSSAADVSIRENQPQAVQAADGPSTISPHTPLQPQEPLPHQLPSCTHTYLCTHTATCTCQVFRQLRAEYFRLASEGVAGDALTQAMQSAYRDFVDATIAPPPAPAAAPAAAGSAEAAAPADAPAAPATPAQLWQCPKVRFGRTELAMPVITCGGMRQQQTWRPKEGTTLADIDDQCQVRAVTAAAAFCGRRTSRRALVQRGCQRPTLRARRNVGSVARVTMCAGLPPAAASAVHKHACRRHTDRLLRLCLCHNDWRVCVRNRRKTSTPLWSGRWNSASTTLRLRW
jgi:hypothetical protein